jgi:hypothetical protein
MFKEASETMGRPGFRQSVERACRAVALLSCVERWTLNSFQAGNCCQTAGANFAPTWIFCSEMLKVFGKPADGESFPQASKTRIAL